MLLEIGGSAVKHHDKFTKIFGFDDDRNHVQRDPRMEPLFLRMEKNVPTSTNHIERFHRYVNESVSNSVNKYKKLAILFECINSQISRFNENVLRKLKDYLKNLRECANEIVKENEDRIVEFSKDTCDDEFCVDSLFYSNLYQCELPCTHQILNKRWANVDFNT